MRKTGPLLAIAAVTGGMGLSLTGLLASSATAEVHPHVVATCTSSQLVGWGKKSAGGQEGYLFVNFGFTNHSAHTCSLFGYPHVQMLNAAGHDLPTTDEKGPSHETSPVTLTPGQTAYFQIYYDNFGTGTCPMSAAVDLVPPGNHAAIVLRDAASAMRPHGLTVQTRQCGVLFVNPMFADQHPPT